MNAKLIKLVSKRTMEMDLNVDRKGVWDWGAGVALYGLRRVYEKTGDVGIFDFIKKFFDYNVTNTVISYSINTTAPLLSVLFLYKDTHEQKYLDFAEIFAEWILYTAPRTKDGVLEHSAINFSFYGEIWVDTIFMAGVFLVETGLLTGNRRYVEEGIKQAKLHFEKLQNKSNGLLYHGYSYNTSDYMSECFWARGNSWATVSISEMFEGLCTYKKERDQLCNMISSQLRTLVEIQDESGLWHTILDDASSYCETSASAGLVYGMLKGIKLGYIDKDFANSVRKGFNAVVQKIDTDGTVLGVSAGTGIQTTLEAYKTIPEDRIMPWGQGLVLLMLCEELF